MKEGQQPTYHEAAANMPPFMDSAWMAAIQSRAYQAAQPEAGKPITPESKFCHLVNIELKRILREEGIEAAYHHEGRDLTHGFVTASHDGKTFLLDLQYQQFVPEERRAQLPNYLAFPYNSEQDVIDGLRQYHVKEDRIEHWTTPLFPKPLSTNLQTRAFDTSWPQNPNPEDNSRR